jgi:hypothetical protein
MGPSNSQLTENKSRSQSPDVSLFYTSNLVDTSHVQTPYIETWDSCFARLAADSYRLSRTYVRTNWLAECFLRQEQILAGCYEYIYA